MAAKTPQRATQPAEANQAGAEVCRGGSGTSNTGGIGVAGNPSSGAAGDVTGGATTAGSGGAGGSEPGASGSGTGGVGTAGGSSAGASGSAGTNAAAGASGSGNACPLEEVTRAATATASRWTPRTTFSSYGNYARGGTNMVLENSVFKKVKDPHYYDTGTLVAIGNSYESVTGMKEQSGTTYSFFDPSKLYPYQLDATADVAALLARCAGPRAELGL